MIAKKTAYRLCLAHFTLLMVFMLHSTGVASPRTRSEWIAEYNALDAAVGTQNAIDPDSAVLAWGESYTLSSYLNMYEATQDTKHLDSFVSHFDIMVGNMDDADADGYDGWDTGRYSLNVMQNGGAEEVASADFGRNTLYFSEDFETPNGSDPTLPDGWTRTGGADPATAFLDSGNADTGIYGCTMSSDNDGSVEMLRKDLPGYEADALYVLRFRGKVSGTDIGRGICVVQQLGVAYLGSVSFKNRDDWEEHQFIFRAPASGGTLQILFYNDREDVSGFSAHYDNLEVYRLDAGGLLPQHWTRWGATTNTAYIDYDPANVTAGYAGFAVETDPGAGSQILQAPLQNLLVDDNPNYEPGIEYTVVCDAKTTAPDVGWKLLVYDSTASEVLMTMSGNNTVWASFEGSFTAPADPGHDVQVLLYHNNVNISGAAHFDYIDIYQFAEYAVHDGMIAAPVAKFIMMASRGQMPVSYQASASNYLGVLENHLIPNWDSTLQAIDGSRSVYVAPDDGSLDEPNDSLPHNQYLALASAYAFLSRADLTNSLVYADRAEELVNTFSNELRVVTDNAYEWNYWDELLPDDDAPWYGRVEDISHANVDLIAAIACRQANIAFADTDMERFANTFIHKVWDGDPVTPELSWRIDGSSIAPKAYVDGWIGLGAYDPQIYDIAKTIYDAGWEFGAYPMAVLAEIIKGVLVFNETFETPDSGDGTLPEGWFRLGSTSSTAYLDSGNAFEGGSGLTVETDGGGWRVLETPLAGYDPGMYYQVRAMGRKSGNPSVNGRLEVYDYTTATVLGEAVFTDADWKLGVVEFTSPLASGNDIRIRLYTSSYASGGVVHFDNVEVRTGLKPGGPTACIIR
ncbi:MAG: hypothetical protein ABFR33_04080 [Verrucomicrobiota bacterium]